MHALHIPPIVAARPVPLYLPGKQDINMKLHECIEAQASAANPKHIVLNKKLLLFLLLSCFGET